MTQRIGAMAGTAKTGGEERRRERGRDEERDVIGYTTSEGACIM